MMGLPKMLLPVPPNATLIGRMRDSMAALNPRKICIGANGVNMALLEPFDRMTTRLYHAYTATMSETVLLARRFVEGEEFVIFGMPDTYIEDDGVFDKLKTAIYEGADIAVGVFKARPEQRGKLGMCRLDKQRIIEIVDKPAETKLEWAWGALAWRSAFWERINPTDPHVGYAVQRGIDERLDVRGVMMDGGYWDCGTPEEYFGLIRYLGAH